MPLWMKSIRSSGGMEDQVFMFSDDVLLLILVFIILRDNGDDAATKADLTKVNVSSI